MIVSFLFSPERAQYVNSGRSPEKKNSERKALKGRDKFRVFLMQKIITPLQGCYINLCFIIIGLRPMLVDTALSGL